MREGCGSLNGAGEKNGNGARDIQREVSPVIRLEQILLHFHVSADNASPARGKLVLLCGDSLGWYINTSLGDSVGTEIDACHRPVQSSLVEISHLCGEANRSVAGDDTGEDFGIENAGISVV